MSFKVYSVLAEDLKERKASGKYSLDKLKLYNKFKNPLSKDHSEVVGLLILWHFIKSDPDNDKLLKGMVEKQGDKKLTKRKSEGLFQDKVYSCKRVYSGRTLGESHDFNDLPTDLLEILDLYFDTYKQMRDSDT